MARKPNDGFTEDEREAMKARAAEVKASRSKSSKADGEADILAKIAEMTEPDKGLATRIHALVRAAAPSLTCRTWYGMPAYARGDKVVCFFQAAGKFKSRYATFGFSDQAHLDDGNFWPNAYAVIKLTKADEATLTALIKKAAG